MDKTDLPFNVEIMKVDREKVRNLRPVRSTDIMESSGQKLGPTDNLTQGAISWEGDTNVSSAFNPDGLFSIEIFGRVGEDRRDNQFSYVDIRVAVFHPIIYRALGKIKGLYHDILAGKAYAEWNAQTKDFEASNELDGDTGFLFFVKYWDQIQFKTTGSPARKARIDLIEKYKDRALTDKILIMPAGLRDVRVGSGNRLEHDEINDVYRRIIGISRTVAGGTEKISSPALNYSRYQLQMAFNEAYAIIEKMLRNKSGFVQRRWARRRIFDSSRNVIASMDTSKRQLGDPHAPRATDTILGLYQTIAAARPFTIYKLRNGYLSEIFDVYGTSTLARLVDPKTLRRADVELSSIAKDRWTTTDGLQRVINSYGDVENRHKPVVIEGYYLGLIYKGPDQTFRIFGDINEVPEHLDRKYVEPISLVEFIYLAGYRDWNSLKVIITRYPVTGLGSSYPSDLYVKTTSRSERRTELGTDWQPLGEDYVASEFPVKGQSNFIDAQQVSPVRMPGLGADFDGDTCSALPVFSDEGRAEVTRQLHSREAYTDPAGGLRTSATTDTIALVMRNMTGDYPTPDY